MDFSGFLERGVKRVWDVSAQPAGPSHRVGMVLEPGNFEEYDPFLLLAEDWFERGVFDVHPHRGIETVTYVIDGKLEHYDNKAGEGQLEPGDVQWMTAGRGVIHKEDPAVGSQVHSLQLWINLPRERKLTEPRYQNLRSADMPVRQERGALARVFSGSSGGVSALTKNYVPITMVELTVEAGSSFVQDLPGTYNGFMYVLNGRGVVGRDRTEVVKNQALLLEFPDTEQDTCVRVEATEDLVVLFYAGRPLREPVVAQGPFVMNTKEEIRQAYNDYMTGKFV